MLVVTVRRSWRRPESIEDQVSTDISRVIKVSEPDLVARGIAIDLLQMAKRIGPQCEAAGHKDLSGEKSLTLGCIAIEIEGAIKPNGDDIEELSMCSRWTSELARSAKPPNTKICRGRKTSPWTTLLPMIDGAIKPYGDGTVELSMKAPMSVSKPADLG